MNSTNPASHSSDEILICLQGYTPSTRNKLNGCHWSVLAREKKRDGMALLQSLKSSLQSMQQNHVIGTDGILNAFKTGVALLDSFPGTDGKPYLAGSCPKKYSRKQKKKQPSK